MGNSKGFRVSGGIGFHDANIGGGDMGEKELREWKKKTRAEKERELYEYMKKTGKKMPKEGWTFDSDGHMVYVEPADYLMGKSTKKK